MSTQIHRGTLRGGLAKPISAALAPLQNRDIIFATARQLAEADLLTPAPLDEEHRAHLKAPGGEGYYVIPDAELKQWHTAAAITVAWLTGGVAGVLLGGLAALVITVWKHHAFLPVDQGALLVALKRHPHSTLDELLDHLPPEVSVTPALAAELLKALQDLPLANGKRAKLADVQDGRWFPVDV
jgi:hypothetical protein